MPRSLLTFFEPRLGASLNHVSIHADAAAAGTAKTLCARAFADGGSIGFAAGQYAPETLAGKRLLAHELAHVAHGHSGIRRYPDAISVAAGLEPAGPTRVTLTDTAEPLAQYAWLRDRLGVEGWESLNDAARLRGLRQSHPIPMAPAPDEASLSMTSRSEMDIPLGLVLSPKPYTDPSGFQTLMFESLRAGPFGAMGGAAEATRDEISRRWAMRHVDVVGGVVKIQLVDPNGVLATPCELLFTIAGVPISTTDGRVWISDVDAAVSPGDLAAVTQDVATEAGALGDGVLLAMQAEELLQLSTQTRNSSHEDVSAKEAERLRTMLSDLSGQTNAYMIGHPLVSPLLGASVVALGVETGAYQTWLDEHRRVIAAAQPDKNLWENAQDHTAALMKAQDEAPWYAKGLTGQAAAQSAMVYGPADLVTGGAVSADVELRRAFRHGSVAIKGFREGETAIRDRGLIVGSINVALMIATAGLGSVFTPATLGGQMAFGGLTAMATTAIPLTVQAVITNRTTLSDPMAQNIWQSGAMSPGDIALVTLGAGAFGAASGGLMGWAGQRPNMALGRQLVAESVGNPSLVRTLGPNLEARAVAPGVVEVVEAGHPGVIRFTAQGLEFLPSSDTAPVASAGWDAPPAEGSLPPIGPVQGIKLASSPGGSTALGIVAGERGWVVATPRTVVGVGGWRPSQIAAGGMPGAGLISAGQPPMLLMPGDIPPGLSPTAPILGSPTPGGGPVFVDIQGGPAMRPDTGQPTFLPSIVGATPEARGVLLEPGDYVPGFAGITTGNPGDLALSRALVQNMPHWPAGSGLQNQPPPWLWDPSLSFPTQGPVQVLNTPGVPGTMPIPQAFFPPIGGDIEPGMPRLIPIATQGLSAQADVKGLQPTTHAELHGQVDQAYWRRPFALGAADPKTVAAIGREIAQWLKPGGFLELRLLRARDEAQVQAMTKQIPGGRVVSVGASAIRVYNKTGLRPPGLNNDQWAVLQDALSDIRGEYGQLGQGEFRRIIRIYRGQPTPQRVLVVGAERPDELDWAAGLHAKGHDVTVVNPVTSPAAQAFRQGGGKLVTAAIETLPAAAKFDVIREDFPFPLGPAFEPSRAFAQIRIDRLLPGGRWVVATESSEFASALQAAASVLPVNATCIAVPLAHEATPSSPWLREKQRFIIVFTRKS